MTERGADPLLLEQMTWTEVRDALDDELPIVLPLGSIEQHGPHLPLGTDAFIPHELAKLVARSRRMIVSPPLFYAAYSRPRSGGGRGFPGSTGVPGPVLHSVVAHVVRDLLRQGFRRILVLNGHWENASPLYEALEEAVEEAPDDGRLLLINWWDLITDEDLGEIFDDRFPGWETEHAAVTETSLIEALLPSMVRADLKTDGGADRLLPYDIFPPPDDTIPKLGIGWSAKGASSEIGSRLVDVLVDRIGSAIDAEFSQAGAS